MASGPAHWAEQSCRFSVIHTQCWDWAAVAASGHHWVLVQPLRESGLGIRGYHGAHLKLIACLVRKSSFPKEN